jgi:DNA polymerase alpha subunit A
LLDIDALLQGNQKNTSGFSKPATGSLSLHRPPLFPVSRRPGFAAHQATTTSQQSMIIPTFHDFTPSMDYDDYTPEVSFDNHDNNMDVDGNVSSPSQEDKIKVKTEVTPTHDDDPFAVKEEDEDAPQKISLLKTTKRLRMTAPLVVTPKPEEIAVKDEKFQPISMNSSSTTPSFESNSEFAAVSSGSVESKIDPSLFLKVNPENPSETSLDMYWIDATEINGDIFLFGKILIEKRFVSCCMQVTNCERNLFFLPRPIPNEYQADGFTPRTYPTMDIYKEIHDILLKLPDHKGEGKSFKCKPVKRKYAFEDSSIPREEKEYLKVVYSSKKSIPSSDICNHGGKTFSKIFGISSNALELFLLKRGLSGPCWITIKNPKMINDNFKSWCKLEFTCENPKFIRKYGPEKMKKTVTPMVKEEGSAIAAPSPVPAVSEVNKYPPLPTPPITTFTISLKTAVNPSTHLHEIIAISGIIHTKVALESDTEINTGVMKRFTFLRQLGLSCGNSFPSSFPHDLQSEIKKYKDIALSTFLNERSMLSMFFNKILTEDPDIFISHNLLGFEMDMILSRAVANKLGNWSLLGRLRKKNPPKSVNDRDSFHGRLMCDTYKASKEFLRETSYSLTNLASAQLKQDRQEVDPIDVPKYFSTSADIILLASHTFRDAWLVFLLSLKLQVIPLTKQLTSLSGNLWSRTMRGARAERIEYLLLHEFHAKKYILPEKKLSEFAANAAAKKGGKGGNHHATEDAGDDDEEAGGGNMKVGGIGRKRAKASYAGGLVLEPKKGLYDSYILLLDFNSLYPSIIQEYNLCFTTINWPKYMPEAAPSASALTDGKKGSKNTKKTVGAEDGENSDEESDKEDGVDSNSTAVTDTNNGIPPLPDSSQQPGILPRVIKTLVDRRREVKQLLKRENDPAKRQELDIRQKALKLTANSMYGCLGFSFSRFYARPIAALVTAMGREALQRTVDIATKQMSLDVIYGDTDSVMINTNIQDLEKVKKIGYEVKAAVNKLYKSLELDLDGIFRSMLLLKKKKYAALVVHEDSKGEVTYEKEMKGLDLVRRDWCPISKETGRYVVDQILTEGKSCEEIVLCIHDYLSDLASKIRNHEMPLESFIITKGLNKNPKDYPDCSGQAHLQVALAMIKANKPVNIGDHIPYIICLESEKENATAPQRAYHPDDLRREPEKFHIDYEWYISNQLLPPISRLCEPIEGTSAAILSEKLGLDPSRYRNQGNGNGGDDYLDDNWGFTPRCMMDDGERFKGCLPLSITCSECKESSEVFGLLNFEPYQSLCCPKCKSKLLGKG